MSISSFAQLLAEAHKQTDPQRLLFVFTKVEQPEAPNREQQLAYEQGHGGALIPLGCVDKTLSEINSFNDIAEEAEIMVPDWSILFVAALAGQHPIEPTPELAASHLDQMIEMIKLGRISGFSAFDRSGEALMLQADTNYQDFEPVLMTKNNL